MIWIYKKDNIYDAIEDAFEDNARIRVEMYYPGAEFIGPLPEDEKDFATWQRNIYRAEAVADFIEALSGHEFECDKGDPVSLMNTWVEVLTEEAQNFGVSLTDTHIDELPEDGDDDNGGVHWTN